MMPGQKGCVDGNKEVVQLFEYWLEKAKQGDIDFGAVIACRGPADSTSGTGGVCGREAITSFALDHLKMQIMGDFINRMNPPSNKEVTADKWAYNIARGPASYDFIAWLVNAEMTRVRERAPFPLKIAFYVGQNGDAQDALHTEDRARMFKNVIRPCLAFVGAIESNEAQNGRIQECYSFMPAVDGVRRGERVPLLKAPVWLKKWNPAPVTITLREADRQLHRNSNLWEWQKFADYLDDCGERVVIVRDTAKADEPFHGYEMCSLASIDIHARLALYEQAKCNLFVSNGPATLAFFTERPWLMFAAPNEKDSYFPNTPDGWKTFCGISPGEQLPWSKLDQTIIWQADTFEVMRDAWEGLQSLQAAA